MYAIDNLLVPTKDLFLEIELCAFHRRTSANPIAVEQWVIEVRDEIARRNKSNRCDIGR